MTNLVWQNTKQWKPLFVTISNQTYYTIYKPLSLSLSGFFLRHPLKLKALNPNLSYISVGNSFLMFNINSLEKYNLV